MENVCVCHSTKGSSSWKRLCGEITFYQKSGLANIETVIQCDGKVDQGSERNPRYFRDHLAATNLAKDNSAY